MSAAAPAPGEPGASRVFLSAEWRHLAILTYRIDPAILAPYVPAGTTLDLRQGDALVSVVGFRFLRARVLGIPVPLHRAFEEVNLRLYVRREQGGQVRRGVTFIREIVPRRAVAAAARLSYNEPYVTRPMRSELTAGPGGCPRAAAYAWRGPAGWSRLAVEIGADAGALPAPGSEEAFVTERAWGYTRQRDGATLEYEVRHPPWRVWPVTVARLEADVAELYGPAFAGPLAAPPRSACFAEGSRITLSRPGRL